MSDPRWQPIETAPKDGSEMLLWFANGETLPGWWFSSPKKIDDGWETLIGFIGEPTHWMPLPEPPEAS